MILRIKNCLLVFFLCLMTISLSAKKVTSGLSVTGTYLPTRYSLWDNNVGDWKPTTVNGFGAGLEYNLSVSLPQPGWVFRTGMGCTYSRINEAGNKTMYDYRPENTVTTIAIETYCETLREYVYAYLPIEIGYKLISKGDISVIPFIGLQGKYNIGFTQKGYVESATWYDHYFELFDEYNVESDAERFLLQLRTGLEVEYNNLFLSLSYIRDTERLFCSAYLPRTYKSYFGPFSFNCWQLGLGINF